MKILLSEILMTIRILENTATNLETTDDAMNPPQTIGTISTQVTAENRPAELVQVGVEALLRKKAITGEVLAIVQAALVVETNLIVADIVVVEAGLIVAVIVGVEMGLIVVVIKVVEAVLAIKECHLTTSHSLKNFARISIWNIRMFRLDQKYVTAIASHKCACS